MRKKVLFVSEIKDPYYEDFSSTQIMTNNIITGLVEVADYIGFIALVDDNCNEKNVIDYYSKFVDRVYIIHSHLNLTLHKNKYEQLAKIVCSWINPFQYKKDLIAIWEGMEQYDTLVSHAPALEVNVISKLIKQRLKIKYIQYWSDPYTLAGILPENVSIKRKLHYLIELSMLRTADEIVYGTKTLMDFQRQLFRQLENKMRYVDVSYCCDVEECHMKAQNNMDISLIYSGDYFSTVRNIRPLYDAMKRLPKYKLNIVGNSDLKLENTHNITIMQRQPFQVVQRYENTSDIIVCLLNHSCIQIPGKIFYRINTDQHILIVLDGKYKEQIKKYLYSFERFEFCENTSDSIEQAIINISSKCVERNDKLQRLLSPKMIGYKLLNGSEKNE